MKRTLTKVRVLVSLLKFPDIYRYMSMLRSGNKRLVEAQGRGVGVRSGELRRIISASHCISIIVSGPSDIGNVSIDLIAADTGGGCCHLIEIQLFRRRSDCGLDPAAGIGMQSPNHAVNFGCTMRRRKSADGAQLRVLRLQVIQS